MTISHVEVHYPNCTVETFFPFPLWEPPNPNPPPKFAVGDLVRVCPGVTNTDWRGIEHLYGRVGVVRDQKGVAVEWAGFNGGHDLNKLAHVPQSGWYVPEKYLEPA